MRRVFPIAMIVLPIVNVTIAFAQGTQGGGTGGAGPAGGGGGTTTQPPPTVQYFPGGVAPPPPGQPLGGGNTATYGQFESAPNRGGGATMYGSETSGADLGTGPGGDTITLGGVEGNINADQHVVRKGDTLWGICDYYFRNPYQWPRIWSYNPQIQNPHWIYPGDLIRLRSGGGPAVQTQPGTGPGTGSGQSMIDRRRQVVPDTIFLRDTGFIDNTDKDNWGEVSGANIDKMFLTDTDEIYMHVAEGHDPKVGQELTVFRPVRSVPGGKLVQLEGTVRLDRWDPKTRTARGQITETLDVIERGARIGPVGRKFNVVPPVRNDKELKATIIASIYPHSFYGQNQIVFIDKGQDDGIRPGNRLFIMRRGDDWRRTLQSEVGSERVDQYSKEPNDTQKVPKYAFSDMPEEVIGEIRVLETRSHNAACLVTRSIREIEHDDEAIMRKGY